jgi:hypothetical protein
MGTSQTSPLIAKPQSAVSELNLFIEQRRRAREPVNNLEAFEGELRERFRAAQAEVMGEELARFDIDTAVVEIDGVPHRRVLRSEQTYMTASGPVSVERTLYSTREDGERAVPAMEVSAGIVEGYFTPLAAQHAAWAVAHLTPQEGETMFRRFGAMSPSKSSLDRLPKALSARLEEDRANFEQRLRAGEKVPKVAHTVAVSLDGVLVPMKDGNAEEKRARTRADERLAKGPAGYSEAGCGTLTLYDRDGEPLQTVHLGRMPEKHKATLKEQLAAELDAVLTHRPDLRVVTIADGAHDNWAFLAELPGGRCEAQIVDFFHAAEHLHDAMAAAHGEASAKCESEFQKYRHILRHDGDGVEKVIRHLRYLRDQNPRRKKIATALKYLRHHRHRMQYASFARRNLPIGSGIVEATCKTLVAQRLKRSGMRWRHAGGQAILTLRSFEQSGRFDRAWQMLAATYHREVRLPENVVDIRSRRSPAITSR